MQCGFDVIRRTPIEYDEFEWDDRKARQNDLKHGVTFEVPNAIDRLDLDETSETRELITGLVGDVLLTVCFVQRGHRKRIISARKASRREQHDHTKANSS